MRYAVLPAYFMVFSFFSPFFFSCMLFIFAHTTSTHTHTHTHTRVYIYIYVSGFKRCATLVALALIASSASAFSIEQHYQRDDFKDGRDSQLAALTSSLAKRA